jgi:hypothetical protein
MEKTKDNSRIELRATLNEKLSERFLVVKEHTGMNSNKNVLAFLISDAYDKIQGSRCRKVFVRNEMYEKLEKKAAAQGQSVDIFVQELIEHETGKD